MRFKSQKEGTWICRLERKGDNYLADHIRPAFVIKKGKGVFFIGKRRKKCLVRVSVSRIIH